MQHQLETIFKYLLDHSNHLDRQTFKDLLFWNQGSSSPPPQKQQQQQPDVSFSTPKTSRIAAAAMETTFSNSPQAKANNSPLQKFLDSPVTQQVAKFQQIAQDQSKKAIGEED